MECDKDIALNISPTTLQLPHGVELVNFELCARAGEITAIIGPNGAGKTSLLNEIMAGDQPLANNIVIAQQRFADWHPRARAQHIAMLPQQSQLQFPYTVEDVILLGRIPHDAGIEKDTEIVNQLLHQLDLTSLRSAMYTQLSGGEQQRVQLARVFAQIDSTQHTHPRVLLLDEPFNALDLVHQQSLVRYLRQLCNKNIAVIMVVHDLNIVTQYTDQTCAIFSNGKTVRGNSQALLTTEFIKQLYGVDVKLLNHPTTNAPLISMI